MTPPLASDSTPTKPPQDRPTVAPEPSHRALEAERRQVTVMFCDLVASTEFSQQLDPEDYRAVVRAYQAAAAAALQPHDGYIAQYLGDGLLVYFGWPQAHEDAAYRAVYASLALFDAAVLCYTCCRFKHNTDYPEESAMVGSPDDPTAPCCACRD
jgi:class 3 adenylate cyclase